MEYFNLPAAMMFFIVCLFFVVIYFLPSIIASEKRGKNGIIALNVLLGWTFLGWVGALCWALSAEKKKEKGGDVEMIDLNEVVAVARAMKKYGGSFVSMIGRALLYADPINQQKIKDTWPEYWEEYKKKGE